MRELNEAGLRIANYKSFGELGGGFEQIKPTNIIIGRNNSGKTALIDAVGYSVAHTNIELQHGHRGQDPSLEITAPLSEAVLKAVFSEMSVGGIIQGNHWLNFGRHMLGSKLVFRIRGNNSKQFLKVVPEREIPPPFNQNLAEYAENPFAKAMFYRLAADRDIMPEEDTGSIEIGSNGEGVSRTLARIYNHVSFKRELVEKQLLAAINSIFEPDASFSQIFFRQNDGRKWEVYLQEDGKGAVPLSASGSGLKTVIAVTTFVEIRPAVQKKDLSACVFAFEELENNLHPALQRRLMSYVRKVALERGATVFLTTHSNSVIDFFAKDDTSQIIHVTHDREKSTARVVKTYFEHSGILDDLDVRASDLLQANSVVWVEGPSDRLYFNRWVTLWSDGKLTEGIHYQTVFYGGRLLSRLSCDEPTLPSDDAVQMLRLNRRAIILIDSDKATQQSQINDTKKRLQSEVENAGGLAWITKGRTIENYLPQNAVAAVWSGTRRTIGQYEEPENYFQDCGVPANRFSRKKVQFAEQIIPHITREEASKVLDLDKSVKIAISKIQEWNNLAD